MAAYLSRLRSTGKVTLDCPLFSASIFIFLITHLLRFETEKKCNAGRNFLYFQKHAEFELEERERERE